MRVALVHDDLVQWGGAERMLSALSEMFPEAPVYTSLFDRNHKILNKHFGNKKVITSFLQKIPFWKEGYKALLPLYPIVFEQFDFSGFDLVISQTTRFAKAVITKPATKHICYCHTPPRFLWHYSQKPVNKVMDHWLSPLRLYDQYIGSRVDYWIAGSGNAANRIKSIYKQESEVIHPFVDLSKYRNFESFDGGYFLVVSRLNDYKKVDLAIKASNRLKLPLKIVGTGPDFNYLSSLAGSQVQFLGSVDDQTLAFLISGCKALIVCAEEDFGLVSLEAQALGKPVVAFNRGGIRETVIDGKSGFLFNEQTVESLIAALDRLDKDGYNSKDCLNQARLFSKEIFIKKFALALERLVNIQ